MKRKIDHIFKRSRYDRGVTVRPELWQKLERRLDDAHPSGGRLKSWMIAASIVVIFSMATWIFITQERYEVEDLTINSQPNFSKEEIYDLEKYYALPKKIKVNPYLG